MVMRNQVEDETLSEDLEEGGQEEEKGMKDEEILSILRNEISTAAGSATTSKLQENRRAALKYYMGDPYGDETEGRSAVVTTEFRDTVESLLPQLMKIFMASDVVVQFQPETPKDEEGAKQATDYVNHIFMTDNKGFMVLYTMIKDALLFKNGIVKIFWDETKVVTKETYKGLTVDERNAVLLDPEVEPIAYSEYDMPVGHNPWGNAAPQLPSPQSAPQPPGPMGPPQGLQANGGGPGVPPEPQPPKLCDLTIRRTKTKGQAKVVCVPPEEFLLTQRADGIQGSRFCAHRMRKSVSDLIALGISKEKAEQYAGSQSEGEYSLERQQRFSYDGDTSPLSDSADKSARYVWLYECYALLDVDGDGIAEPWKVLLVGDQYELIAKEEWEGEWPFESVSPIMMPHKFYGLSMYDLVQQWQRIQSTLMRQFLDNVYSINNNRIAVNADRVNLDDLLTNRPNALVRTIGAPQEAIMPLQPQPIGNTLIPSMEYVNSMREKATGVTSYNQGLDANSLNKTASGITQIMGAAQERILLIARIFAETGISGIFTQLLRLTVKHQDQKRVVQLRGKWVDVDPSSWNSGMKAVTDVALGTNNKDQMLLHLNQVLAVQEKAMQSGSVLVDPKKIYNTLAKVIENTGLKHVELYFNDPDQMKPPPPKPSEEEIKQQGAMKIESGKAQAAGHMMEMELQAKAQEKMMSSKIELTRVAQDAKNQSEERELKLRIAREKNLTDIALAKMGGDQKTTQTEVQNQDKKKPIRMEVQRDPVSREITGLTPIYEEIKKEADPGTDLTPIAASMLPEDGESDA
jgi:hypothetical protein